MTEQDGYLSEAPTAATSGGLASERFRERVASNQSGVVDVERVNKLASRAVQALNDIVVEEAVSYDEYSAFKAWLIKVGEDGEWPLFLDVWLEHSVEDVATAHRDGSKGSIEGPYYIEDSREIEWDGTIPMREDEPGTPMSFSGQVRAVDGTPLKDSRMELWHADNDGFYSQFAPSIPEWNLHFKVHTPGHELLTAQLYFLGDPHNEDKIASAVKPELILDPKLTADGKSKEAVYDFVLDLEV